MCAFCSPGRTHAVCVVSGDIQRTGIKCMIIIFCVCPYLSACATERTRSPSFGAMEIARSKASLAPLMSFISRRIKPASVRVMKRVLATFHCEEQVTGRCKLSLVATKSTFDLYCYCQSMGLPPSLAVTEALLPVQQAGRHTVIGG